MIQESHISQKASKSSSGIIQYSQSKLKLTVTGSQQSTITEELDSSDNDITLARC